MFRTSLGLLLCFVSGLHKGSGFVFPGPSVRNTCVGAREGAASSAVDGPCTRKEALVAGLVSATTALFVAASPARAERTLTTFRESYRRYVPRIRDAIEAYDGLTEAVDKQDWAAVEAVVAPKGVLDRAVSPMGIFATTYSDSNINEQTTQMRQDIALLKISVEKLNEAVQNKDGEGLKVAYGRGRTAINMYVTVANGDMPRSLEKLAALPDH